MSLLLLSCRPLARQMSKTFALLPLGALLGSFRGFELLGLQGCHTKQVSLRSQ